MSQGTVIADLESLIEQVRSGTSVSELSNYLRNLDEEQIITNPEIRKKLVSLAHTLSCRYKRGTLIEHYSVPNIDWVSQIPEILHAPSFQNLLRKFPNARNDIANSFLERLQKETRTPAQHEILLLEISRLPIIAETVVGSAQRLELEHLADSIEKSDNPARFITRVATLSVLIQYPTVLYAINSRDEEILEALQSITSRDLARSLVNALLILSNQEERSFPLYRENMQAFEHIGLKESITKALLSKVDTKLKGRDEIKKILESKDSGRIRDYLDTSIQNLGWPNTRSILSDITLDQDIEDDTASIIAGAMSPLGVIDIGLVLHCVANNIQLPAEIVASALGKGDEYTIDIGLLEEHGLVPGFDSDCHKFSDMMSPQEIKAYYLMNSRTGLILSEAIYRRPGVLHYLIDSNNPVDREIAKSFLESIIISRVIPSHIKKDASQILKLFQ